MYTLHMSSIIWSGIQYIYTCYSYEWWWKCFIIQKGFRICLLETNNEFHFWDINKKKFVYTRELIIFIVIIKLVRLHWNYVVWYKIVKHFRNNNFQSEQVQSTRSIILLLLFCLFLNKVMLTLLTYTVLGSYANTCEICINWDWVF